jgi:hypothetical protein
MNVSTVTDSKPPMQLPGTRRIWFRDLLAQHSLRQQVTEPDPALRSQAVLRRVARALAREGERDLAMFAEASEFVGQGSKSQLLKRGRVETSGQNFKFDKTFVLFWGAYHTVSTVPYPVQGSQVTIPPEKL